jgi:hypothetical protein
MKPKNNTWFRIKTWMSKITWINRELFLLDFVIIREYNKVIIK